jgi:hypothetical protein
MDYDTCDRCCELLPVAAAAIIDTTAVRRMPLFDIKAVDGKYNQKATIYVTRRD